MFNTSSSSSSSSSVCLLEEESHDLSDVPNIFVAIDLVFTSGVSHLACRSNDGA